MLDKLDEIIKRFVAVFLFPLINMLIMISITYFATSADKTDMSSKINVSVTSVLTKSAEFIRSNFTTISSALHDFQGTVQTITSASAAASLFIFVLTIYLIDRVVYYIGFYCPPSFKFDLNSYEAKANEGRKGALDKIFKTSCGVAKSYGAIGAYLGHKNSDPNRINQRNKFVSSIETAKTVLAYTKAYILYLVVVFVPAAYNGVASWIGAPLVLIALVAVWVVTVCHLSFQYRRLVNYDLDSFIWDRSYSAGTSTDINVDLLLADARKPACWWEPKFLSDRLYLKGTWVAPET